MYNKSDQPSIKKQIEYRLKTIYNTIAKEQQNINNAKYTRYRAGPELYQGGYRKRKTQKRKSRKSRK